MIIFGMFLMMSLVFFYEAIKFIESIKHGTIDFQKQMYLMFLLESMFLFFFALLFVRL